MITSRFVIKATSDKTLVRIVVAVRSTEACMGIRIKETQNIWFDLLRGQGFDAVKITFEMDDEES